MVESYIKPKLSEIKDNPREIDKLVAEKVLGLVLENSPGCSCCYCSDCKQLHDECICGYSEDIGMAWEVVEKLIKKQSYVDLFYDPGKTEKPWLMETGGTLFNTIKCYEKTAPMAICRAALLAVGALEQEK